MKNLIDSKTVLDNIKHRKNFRIHIKYMDDFDVFLKLINRYHKYKFPSKDYMMENYCHPNELVFCYSGNVGIHGIFGFHDSQDYDCEHPNMIREYGEVFDFQAEEVCFDIGI